MSDMSDMSAGPTAQTPARIRLRALTVHALALVSEGANLVRWADVRKGKTTMEISKALVLPKAAQEQLSSGLTQACEATMALLDLVKVAEVTEEATAAVPVELLKQISNVGMMLAALADQYAPAQPANQQAGSEPESGMELSPEEMAMAKSLVATIIKNARSSVSAAETVTKGRVKMSFPNALKLQTGLLEKLYAIVDELVPLVSQFGGDAAAVVDACGDGKTNKSASTQSTQQDPLARLESSMSKLNATVEAIAKARNPSNVVPLDSTTGAAPRERIPYGANLSKIVKSEQGKADTTDTTNTNKVNGA